ncbi:hypothetical protein LZ009_13540 [Ramlibacter sp. XY19]|nr:hypothetical protein [Ramlibacter paludis]MCG2593803.1 hypothetical protein [Ramlibacter paludis]
MNFKTLCVLVLLALGGCASGGAAPYGACAAQTTYQCQVDLYMRVGG